MFVFAHGLSFYEDVVSAYKSVLKEKEALESTLAALSSSSSLPAPSTPRRSHRPESLLISTPATTLSGATTDDGNNQTDSIILARASSEGTSRLLSRLFIRRLSRVSHVFAGG